MPITTRTSSILFSDSSASHRSTRSTRDGAVGRSSVPTSRASSRRSSPQPNSATRVSSRANKKNFNWAADSEVDKILNQTIQLHEAMDDDETEESSSQQQNHPEKSKAKSPFRTPQKSKSGSKNENEGTTYATYNDVKASTTSSSESLPSKQNHIPHLPAHIFFPTRTDSTESIKHILSSPTSRSRARTRTHSETHQGSPIEPSYAPPFRTQSESPERGGGPRRGRPPTNRSRSESIGEASARFTFSSDFSIIPIENAGSEMKRRRGRPPSRRQSKASIFSGEEKDKEKEKEKVGSDETAGASIPMEEQSYQVLCPDLNVRELLPILWSNSALQVVEPSSLVRHNLNETEAMNVDGVDENSSTLQIPPSNKRRATRSRSTSAQKMPKDDNEAASLENSNKDGTSSPSGSAIQSTLSRLASGLDVLFSAITHSRRSGSESNIPEKGYVLILHF
jgi:hypothetical protein